MQVSTLFTLAFAAGSAMAHYGYHPSNDTISDRVSYTTEVVTSYETYCPYATSVVVGSSTYTVTEPTTLTISDCPCTVIKPVTTTSSVHCNTCTATGTGGSYPTSAPVYPNSTVTYAPTVVGSTYVPSATPTGPITANSGNKAVTVSGAALAGLLGLAAYIL